MAHVHGLRTPVRLLVLAGALLALSAPSEAWAASSAPAPVPSGGGGLAPNGQATNVPPPPAKHAHGTWMSGFTLTEDWPPPESGYEGELVGAPGLSGTQPIDWPSPA